MRASLRTFRYVTWPSKTFPRLVTIIDSRHFHRSITRSEDSNIFPNDLQKTLTAHRTSNRAAVVRKVFPGTSPEHGPLPAPPNDSADSGPSIDLSSEVRKKPTGSVKRSNRKPPSPRRARSQSPSLQGQWSADSADGLPDECPWLDYIDPETKPSDAMSHLDVEIRALERYMLPTPREHETINQLVASISSHLAGIIPSPPLVTGSWQTGFAPFHSSLDLLLPINEVDRSVGLLRNPRSTKRKNLHMCLQVLSGVAKALRHNPMFSRVHMSYWSPVLTAIHTPTDLQLKFVCGKGLPSSAEYISSFAAEYPTLGPLYMVTRTILEARDMLGADRSSISPTALLVLIAAFLKMNHGRFQSPGTLGQQLLALLQTYGQKVDLETNGVSVDPPGFFNRDTIQEKRMHDCDVPSAQLLGQKSLLNVKRTAAKRRNFKVAGHLCIQDPSNYRSDMGSSCTRTSELQGAFADAYERLHAFLDAWKPPGDRPLDSILTHALRANFDFLQAKRMRLAFGLE